MNTITNRIKSIVAVSLFAATMVAGATTPTTLLSENQEAFGEGYSYTNIMFVAGIAIYDEDARPEAIDSMLAYAENYASDGNRQLIENAVAQIEWSEEGIDVVIAVIYDSSIDYLDSLDDEQVWYNTFSLTLTTFLWSLTYDDMDFIDEAAADLTYVLEYTPNDVDSFALPVLVALANLVSDDDMEADELYALLDELELAAGSN